MSTVWEGDTFPQAGQSDVEQMAQIRHFNTPVHNRSETLKASVSDLEVLDEPRKEEEEGIVANHQAGEEHGSDPEAIALEPPPDGGLTAWLQVLMGHLMNFNTWGYINSYGLFEAYYIDNLHLGASAISWTASIQIFLLCFIGTVSGRALDAGYYRHTLMLGCAFQVFAIFMTSLADRYWQLFLAQGICQGIGNGLVFTPTVGLVSTYFTRKRSLALGIVLSGSVTGGIVFPLMAETLLPKLGFAWTVRIMGFVALFNAAAILLLARTRIAPRRSGPLVELSAFKEMPYSLFAIGTFLVLWPVYYAYDYINIFATNRIHVSSSTSLTILLLINAVGYPGRILPALISDRYIGPLNTLLLLTICCSVLLFAWTAVTTYAGLLAFVIVYGIINAGVQGLFLTALSSLTTDLSKMGTRTGMILAILAFPTLTGAPIAGALIDAEQGGFLGVQVFGGTCVLVGTSVLIAARTAKTGWVWRVRM